MRIILLLLLPFICLDAASQKQPVVKNPGSKTFKLKTLLGKNQNGAVVTLDEALQLINFPLQVVDANNDRCPVLSYNFLYRRKAFIENETTGKKEATFNNVSEVFKVTPLPPLWRDNMAASLKTDEELYFFDIIVKERFGRKVFAPELKIRIQ